MTEDGFQSQELIQIIEDKGMATFYQEYFQNMTLLTSNADNETLLKLDF